MASQAEYDTPISNTSEGSDAMQQSYTNPQEFVEKKRGGARTGAGRKRQYMPYEVKRLKCRREHSGLARAFISILEKFSKHFERTNTTACMLDGSMPERKGGGKREWTEYDAISSQFSIEVCGSWSKEIFALSFRLTNPDGVKIDMLHDRSVWLRWQRIDEMARVMSRYGWLMARRNRLDNEAASMLKDMPLFDSEIIDWANGN